MHRWHARRCLKLMLRQAGHLVRVRASVRGSGEVKAWGSGSGSGEAEGKAWGAGEGLRACGGALPAILHPLLRLLAHDAHRLALLLLGALGHELLEALLEDLGRGDVRVAAVARRPHHPVDIAAVAARPVPVDALLGRAVGPSGRRRLAGLDGPDPFVEDVLGRLRGGAAMARVARAEVHVLAARTPPRTLDAFLRRALVLQRGLGQVDEATALRVPRPLQLVLLDPTAHLAGR